MVKTGTKVKIIPVADVQYLQADDDYVSVFTQEGSYLKNKTMSFSITSEVTKGIAMLTLAGSLDSSSAPQMQLEIQKVAAQSPTELVLYLSELSFMASAGLRMLVFAKQKLGTSVQIYLVQPQGQIIDTLQMRGIIHSVHIVDNYPS